MTSASWLSMLASTYFTELAMIIVIIAGLVVTASNWRKHPRPAQIALAGLSILLILAILGPLLGTGLQVQMMQNRQSMSVTRFALLTFILGFFLSLLRALGFGLVIAAIWVGRPQPAPDTNELP